MYQDSNQYEHCYDDYDDRSKLSTPIEQPPLKLPAPTSVRDEDDYDDAISSPPFRDEDANDDYDDAISSPPFRDEDANDDYDDAISSPPVSDIFVKESKPQDPKFQSRIARKLRPPPPVPVSCNNTTEKKDQQDQKPMILEPLSGSSAPPINGRHLKENKERNNCSNAGPLIASKPPPTGLENRDNTKLSDVNSCKSLPLPNLPDLTNNDERGKYLNVKDPNSKLNLPTPKNMHPNPPNPTKFNTPKTIKTGYEDSAGNDKSNLKPDHSSDTKPFALQPTKSGNLSASNEEQCYLDTVNKSFDFESGIDSSAQMGDTFNKGSDFYDTNLLARHGDTQKGSDFYDVNPLAKHSDTQRGSDFDISVGAADSHSIKPKTKPKSDAYVNVHVSEIENKPTVTQLYVNEFEPKPEIPPRNPLIK